ncbi:MAG: tRNA (N(6)-L-threonylcarbamoyladenosine(37)-C(2))-methylthiotransferase MtaB [Saprospiraceae bacterium]|nr:tRNA (N(6)-L-threonylcarbamoyladenosine(37)-C(2))-methylthiotransferase MtaB [Saprospiraceae bacterium]
MSAQSSVALHTLGCKLNFSESSSIRQRFEDRGFIIHDFSEASDVYVINTCSVTEFADRKCRSAVRKALRQNPSARVIVIGCYAQLKPQEIASIEGVDLVLGAAEKFNVVNYVETLSQQTGKGLVHNTDIQTINSFEEAFSFGDRTRSFLKVQDGCDYNCSFCTIPLARGKSRSGSMNRIMSQIKELEAKDVGEVVLTGVNIGDYGKGLDEQASFLDLIREVEVSSSIKRFRISSIEPNLCSDEIIKFVSSSTRFMPHFHMPLQSGSNAILAQMRRRYRKEHYRDRVLYIKELMPHACIGADVIVGFPGEREEDFEETLSFLQELPLSYLHVFTYSQRTDTLAADRTDQVPLRVRRDRNAVLRLLSQKKHRAFIEECLESTRPVLFEPVRSDGNQHGYTDNYIKVQVTDAESLLNQVHPVELTTILGDMTVRGKLQKKSPAVRLTSTG